MLMAGATATLALLEPMEIEWHDAILKHGILRKKSRYLKMWRTRYIVLTKDSIRSFKSEDAFARSERPTETISFSKGFTAEVVGKGKSCLSLLPCF